MELGKELKSFQKEKGWSVTEFARRLNVSRATIHSWFSGRRYPQKKNRVDLIKIGFIYSGWVDDVATKIETEL